MVPRLLWSGAHGRAPSPHGLGVRSRADLGMLKELASVLVNLDFNQNQATKAASGRQR